MSEALSPADRSSLAAERGAVNMAVGGLLVFEAGAALTLAMVRARIAERIHLIPRLRQRLEEPIMGIANPVWVDDASFDLDWHVRQASLPRPGGPAELGAFVGREFSHRLDRTRPLWEMTLLEGVGEDRLALLLKAHHALVDGMAAIGLAALVLDPSATPLEIPPPEGTWEPQPYDLRRHVARLVTTPMALAARPVLDGALRALDPDPRRAAADARGVARDMRRATEVAIELARQRPQAPMTPLNRPISPNRRYASAQVDLATVKTVSRNCGGTVNDTLLAVVTGMLARYLAAVDGAGAEPLSGRPPVALVPVSVRSDPRAGDMGNQISTVFVDLPVSEPDLGRRIATIAAQTRLLKESAAVRAGALMVGASGVAPPLISGMLARAMGSVRAFNVVVSNLPGPQQPFYLAGVRTTDIYPIVPLNPANQGLTVGILSYDGDVCFGLLADRDLTPGLAVAAAGLTAELDGLTAAVAA
ncbi:wax ester/triacylglycerol synthase family O-acyltransferase [Conexibacter sp. DBS9H8]|uniref:wax ester/triacylglycerol synthase family O-acyltransferase n=1 Tax=Conexibacter sp. DBS9H8 TaxID=2937801 RepID=UPI00200E2A28|nr:wax ester/triacylglycerol synthase family O-acyltransferase [Conexibacter sp. DBS9H8]